MSKTLKTLFLLFMLMPCAAVHALNISIPAESQAWYYEIGGAEPVSAPLNPNPTSKTYTLGSMTLGYSCGNFDIIQTVMNLFENMEESLEATLKEAATGFVGSLPLYFLQRALPGFYELFQTYSAKFQVMFGDALKTCEQYETDILAGNDPYAGWKQLAKAENWRIQMQIDADAVAAKRNVEKDDGNKGFTWVGGKAGGKSQPPAEPVRDTTKAGWNVALNRDTDDSSAYTGPDVRLTELFPTPASAGNYAVDVLGEMPISVCDTCARQAIPGHGLLPKYESSRATVATDLATLNAGTGVPAFTDLQDVSSANVGISAKVIETLRLLPPGERGIMMLRLKLNDPQTGKDSKII